MNAVLFDFGGTLDGDGITWGDRFYPLYEEAGIKAPRPDFNKAFYASDDNLPLRFDLKGLSLEDTVKFQVRCVLEQLEPGKQGLGLKISERFIGQCRDHFKRNRPMLERLAKRYKLGIVSNFYGNLDSVLESEGLNHLFDVVADSGVVGSLKPEPAIFEFAARRLDVALTKCVMVGDSIARDMKGAEGLAMPHALLNPSASECCPSAWRLRILPDLEARLA